MRPSPKPPSRRHRLSRRTFLKTSSAALAGLWFDSRGVLAGPSPSGKLNIGVVGVANRGWANLSGVASQNVVALCDVDQNYLDKALQHFPKAATYRDFRRMIDRTDLDAVVVSTPDHTHAVATMAALESGRHVYCEKPLAHTLVEVRTVTETAANKGLATQLGTQIHSMPNYRRVVELVRSGIIGPVREVHVFCDKCWGGGQLPEKPDPIPPTFDFDLWLGPAAERPFAKIYHPAQWRRFWDFGGGTIGDMACHYMDLPFWALDLNHPVTVETLGPEPSPLSAPLWTIVHYEFPARAERPGLTLTWYDGKEGVDHFARKGLADWRNGVVFVGDKGRIVADYTRHELLPAEAFKEVPRPKPSIPDSPGHYEEWFRACRGGTPSLCRFEYSGPLTETVLLGIVAYRTGCKLTWDAERMKARGWFDAKPYLHRVYREGWKL